MDVMLRVCGIDTTIELEVIMPDERAEELLREVLAYSGMIHNLDPMPKEEDEDPEEEEQEEGYLAPPPVKMEKPDYEKKKNRGFLTVQCEECKRIKSFCARTEIDTYTCECGGRTKLKNMRPLYLECECGKNAKYMTNLKMERYSQECVDCGNLVDVALNERETAYVTVNRY